MHEMPPHPSDQSPPHLPALALPGVAGGAPLFAGRLDGKVSKVGVFETPAGFRDACHLYSSQGYFVASTREAVIRLIAAAKRRAKAAS